VQRGAEADAASAESVRRAARSLDRTAAVVGSHQTQGSTQFHATATEERTAHNKQHCSGAQQHPLLLSLRTHLLPPEAQCC